MNRIRHLYAIVGERSSDLLSPALDARFAGSSMHLLAVPSMQERAQRIAMAARAHGREVAVSALGHVHDPEEIRRQLTVQASMHEPATAAINLSGADALYAIPAKDAFKSRGHPAFAIEQDTDWLIWLSCGPGNYESFNVADSLTISQFLSLHGMQWQGAMQSHRSPNRHWNHVAFEFASRAPRARAEIAELNRLMGQVNKDLVVRQAPPPRQSHPNLHWFIDRMIHAGMADIEEGLLRLAGTRELAFAAGGWLEFRVFQAVHALLQRGIVQDLASGVQVRGPDRIAAEWDVVFLANNNLHIIECKARAGTLGNSGVGMDSLYKLEALTRLEGLSAYSMLVSLARPTETEAQRARRKGIETLTLSGNGDVTGRIERWIEQINQAQPATRPPAAVA